MVMMPPVVMPTTVVVPATAMMASSTAVMASSTAVAAVPISPRGPKGEGERSEHRQDEAGRSDRHEDSRLKIIQAPGHSVFTPAWPMRSRTAIRFSRSNLMSYRFAKI